MVEAAGVSLSPPENQTAERAAGDRLPPLFPDDLTPSKAADVSLMLATPRLTKFLVSEKKNGRREKISSSTQTWP